MSKTKLRFPPARRIKIKKIKKGKMKKATKAIAKVAKKVWHGISKRDWL